MKCFAVRIGAHVLFCFAAALPVCGTAINFEAQVANTGGNLTGIPNSPLTIGLATFTSSELRDAEVGLPADQTSVYATEEWIGADETNRW
jgi:hypothetical protein